MMRNRGRALIHRRRPYPAGWRIADGTARPPLRQSLALRQSHAVPHGSRRGRRPRPLVPAAALRPAPLGHLHPRRRPARQRRRQFPVGFRWRSGARPHRLSAKRCFRKKRRSFSPPSASIPARPVPALLRQLLGRVHRLWPVGLLPQRLGHRPSGRDRSRRARPLPEHPPGPQRAAHRLVHYHPELGGFRLRARHCRLHPLCLAAAPLEGARPGRDRRSCGDPPTRCSLPYCSSPTRATSRVSFGSFRLPRPLC